MTTKVRSSAEAQTAGSWPRRGGQSPGSAADSLRITVLIPTRWLISLHSDKEAQWCPQ